MKKTYIIVLSVIGLFLTVTGIAFAFFLLSEEGETNLDVTAADVLISGVEFEDGADVVVPPEGIYPGWIGIKKFKLNPPTDTTIDGIGAYEVVMTTDIDPVFEDWLRIEVYKTTDDTKTIERMEGSLAENPNDSTQVFLTDMVSSEDFDMPTSAIYNNIVTSSTKKVLLDKQNFDLTTYESTTYFVVIYFENTTDNQNATLNASFSASITLNPALPYDPEDDLQAPVLYPGLVPVAISDTGTVTVQDPTGPWYNYTNKLWANAVIVNDETLRTAEAGTIIPMTNIVQMYVWIPRYQYDPDSIVNAQTAIDIKFVDTNLPAHPSFTFGDSELPGIWVGKFEQYADTTLIKPDIAIAISSSYYSISYHFYKIKEINNTNGLNNTSDVHMMKNIDWGAVAYLSQSKYGICTNSTTCSVVSNGNSGATGSTWVSSGKYTSTNHNVTGIYDMAAKKDEVVMGVMETFTGSQIPTYGNSGFTDATMPPKEYYDIFDYGTDAIGTASIRGNTGDATAELKGYNNVTNGDRMVNWNHDRMYFASNNGFWMTRGYNSSNAIPAGIWAFISTNAKNANSFASRSVLTQSLE